MQSPGIALLAAVLGVLWPGTASYAQNANLNSLSPNTVVGRLGSSVPGPAQAIPFATLTQNLFSTGGLVKPTVDGGNVVFQNGTKSAFAIYGPSAPANTFDYDNLRSVIDVEAGTTVQNYNAVGAWIWDNVAATNVGGLTYRVGVGLEAFCVAAIAAAECVGLNPALTDSFDGTAGHSVASTLIGNETDLSTYNAGTVATGLSLVIQGSAQPSADAVQILNNSASVAQWTNALAINDGAVASGGAGLILGAIGAASGTSIGSDPIIFNIFDTGATEHHLSLVAAPNSTASEVLLSDSGSFNGFNFQLATSSNPVSIAAQGSGTNIGLQLQAKGTTGAVSLWGNGSSMFDCNGTNAGYCTVSSTNGLALDNLPVVQGQNFASNTTNGYQLVGGTPSATAPTFTPNRADLKAGIGADTSGDVSIIADNAGTATEVLRATGTAVKIPTQLVSTTGTPTIGSGACGSGTNGAVVSGSTNQSGQITIGGSATTTCTISWSAALAVAPNACVFFPMNATAAATGTTVARAGAPSTASVILTGSALAGANYAYVCL